MWILSGVDNFHSSALAEVFLLGSFEKFWPHRGYMTTREELDSRRRNEAARIRLALNSMRTEAREKVKGGPGTVAFVKEDLCIGCDQCTLVCDDDAIELYDTPLASPILNIDVNRKAKILRDPCTGCRLCVLACPTDAIIMIDR